MANIAVIIANKGWYYAPHFVKSIGGKGPHKKFTVKNITMVDQKNFDPVVEGMRRVVNEAGGTGKLARLADIVVCGKTGTVQNPQGEDHSCFIAFAPMINPKICVAVFVENAGAGGTWAAPIASLIIEKYLKQTVNPEREKSILEKHINYVKGP
jgi:penicillin-binding protein 2